ncbi:PiggyBac transposable element-derived protein 4 [Labeo rohita]|uniref:PiggyBac transposable element-derived protein 4 n=1 Tax=Labeo rohita TaxID=84645 RepID=A0ABQ8LC73_LABRO|nr:PiggyBac transposable element-derived protein 4 [Labeo rohita]
MTRRYSAEETLEYLLRSSDEDNDAPDDEAVDDTSEEEDCTEAEPDLESDSDEEGPVTYRSKNSKILWSPSPPPQTQGRARAEEVLRNTPGPTRYACARVEDIRSAFELFFTNSIQNILLEMTNLEGRRVYENEWNDIMLEEMQAFVGLLILAGVCKSNNEATRSLWDSEMGRAIFRATMPLKTFHKLSRVVRFDDKTTRHVRRESDKLAPIRNIWEKWVERLPLMYNPGLNVTVDECLVAFRGRCSFKQYIPSKPAKYGIKIWAACDAKTNYCWNMQVYTGKPAGAQPERNLGKRVVMEMTHGLQGHIVTCDSLFTSHALGTELLQKKIKNAWNSAQEQARASKRLDNCKRQGSIFLKVCFHGDTHHRVILC